VQVSHRSTDKKGTVSLLIPLDAEYLSPFRFIDHAVSFLIALYTVVPPRNLIVICLG
jgi:hypothetical protein